MNAKKKLKKIEKQLKALEAAVRSHGSKILDLDCEIKGGSSMFARAVLGGQPKAGTRIDRALDGVSDVGQRLDALCVRLGLKIKGKEDMPDFEVVKQSEEKTK